MIGSDNGLSGLSPVWLQANADVLLIKPLWNIFGEIGIKYDIRRIEKLI